MTSSTWSCIRKGVCLVEQPVEYQPDGAWGFDSCARRYSTIGPTPGARTKVRAYEGKGKQREEPFSTGFSR